MAAGCTSLSSTKCPRCGTCSCARNTPCPLHSPISRHGSRRQDVTGCPAKGCDAPGWFESTNDVEVGGMTVCEQGEGWCVDHGFYREAFRADGNIVEFQQPIEMSIEDKARYAGMSVAQFNSLIGG